MDGNTEAKLSYPIDQAPGLTGVPRTALYAAIARGDLRTFKCGRRRLVSVAALREFIASMERKSAPRVAA